MPLPATIPPSAFRHHTPLDSHIAFSLPSHSDSLMITNPSSCSMKKRTLTETPPVRSPHDNSDNDITGEETSNGDTNPRLSRAQTDEERVLLARSLKMMGSLNTDRRMSLWDVVTLNLNSIIGTGIFTTPGLILVLTRSKIMTLALWLAGGIYTLLG